MAPKGGHPVTEDEIATLAEGYPLTDSVMYMCRMVLAFQEPIDDNDATADDKDGLAEDESDDTGPGDGDTDAGDGDGLRSLNKLKDDGEQTILKERRLSTDKLCEKAGDPFQGKTDVWITPGSSNDIRRIEDDYLWYNASQRKMSLPDTTPIFNHATLTSEASTSAPSIEQSFISQPPTVPSTFATTDVVAPAPAPTSHPPH
uniref:Integrase core domain containing protein n=1 Tax=Solanum tuberosum TaxID=4113 RepID=M1D981_SOLTU